MKGYIVTITIAVGLISLLIYTVIQGSDVEVLKDGKPTCGAVCGLMYTCDSRATEEDFRLLLTAAEDTCSDESGTETSYRNEDGSLKHAVIIGDDKVIAKQGTEFDSCIVNWDVSKETALKAFKEVCIERRF